MEHTGWLIDLYSNPTGVSLWLLGDDGIRYCFQHPFPITFYAAGPNQQLRALWRFLKTQPIPVTLSRTERRDLFCPSPVTVLAVQVLEENAQQRLFYQVSRRFPELSFYDADIPLTLRYAAIYGVFPLARCRVVIDEQCQVQRITALDTPWDLDPSPLPLRILSLEPDTDPRRARPKRLKLRFERFEYNLPLQPVRPLLIGLRAILKRHDPDLLLTSWGDTWLLSHLLELSKQAEITLPLNRDPNQEVEHRPEHTYFSYGQVIYRGAQVRLFGRWHIDRFNAMLFHDYQLDGIFELARITGLSVQTVARVSPGSGISAMQMLTALRIGVLVPWHKQQAEHPKTALDLLNADQGGLVYQPTVGLHRDVAEIDFVSMYPSIMVNFNISPEVVGDTRTIVRAATEMNIPADSSTPSGLVPQTLAPMLEKRLKIKAHLTSLPHWHPDRKTYKARASAHKWLLVTCFGYLGYKNARFGRIEAHEAVTAYGREALLRAKEAAEDLGYTVLHMYVDGLWARKPGASTVADFQPLLDEIVARTRLPVALDGIYHWIAFLPSRSDVRVPVANRYFGVFQDGTLKLRGIEIRRRDTPPFIVQTQLDLIRALAHQQMLSDSQVSALPQVIALLRKRLTALRARRVPLEALVVSQKLSRTLDKYRTPSPVARAAAQLEAVGKSTTPGQHIRFLYTLGKPGVHAWDLPHSPEPASIDIARYSELFLRAASSILGPFGVSEDLLRQWLFSNAAYLAPPGFLPPRRYMPARHSHLALPLWQHYAQLPSS